jgi:hypothetical protein
MDKQKEQLLCRIRHGLGQLNGEDLTDRERSIKKLLLEAEADLLTESSKPNWLLWVHLADFFKDLFTD